MANKRSKNQALASSAFQPMGMVLPNMNSNARRQLAAEGLKSMQWDMKLMIGLKPEQRRAIDDAVKALAPNPMLEALRPFLAPDHPFAA
jgi:hypothetical protein